MNSSLGLVRKLPLKEEFEGFLSVFYAPDNSLSLKISGPCRKVSKHLLKTFSGAAMVIKACQSFSALPTIKACTVNLPGIQDMRLNEI